MPESTQLDHSIAQQIRRLSERGIAELAGLTGHEFRMLAKDTLASAAEASSDERTATVVVHPSLVPAASLAALLERDGKPGFVVEDMTDLEEFRPIGDAPVPDQPLYLVHDIDRGDDMQNWSPDEALAELRTRGRRPLTVTEGISWLLQHPDRLEPGSCFMTIGSRRRTARGSDARTPAIWISGGTGRDGRERRGAPKVGWCWARNRHTWLGFASAAPIVSD
ncbi:DUF5701 family protein [Paramicrobacterium agarici]|uniref:DUF5701 family protein n=1 Tax=Paramicrobacterium agarici TaxID=630514 RepID=UPI00114E4951|nr:DUF5701 family protein [Microbacterium agarici]TQO23082.1 hypothetical protein FB385_1927 [Microbacterium agarici]